MGASDAAELPSSQAAVHRLARSAVVAAPHHGPTAEAKLALIVESPSSQWNGMGRFGIEERLPQERRCCTTGFEYPSGKKAARGAW